MANLLDGIDQELEGQHQARLCLKAEIEKVIEQYANGTEKPPFTGAELAVMAIMCMDQGPSDIRIREVVIWVLGRFSYYRDNALADYITLKYEAPSGSLTGPAALEELIQGILSCKVSIDQLWDSDSSYINGRLRDLLDLHVTAEPGKARIFLRRWIEPERKGTFPFLELPKELRDMIYEMVLTMPSVICIDRSPEQGHGLDILQKEVDPDDTMLLCLSGRRYIETTPVQTVLALLSVNKEIHKEAMSCFYSNNSFRFYGANQFRNFAHCVPFERFKWLRDIELRFSFQVIGHDGFPVPEWIAATNSLAQITSLRKFELRLHSYIGDDGWRTLPLSVRKEVGLYRKLIHPGQAPGVNSIAAAASKVQEFTIVGDDSPIMVAYIRDTAARLKAGGKLEVTPAKKKRKRKAVGAMDGGEHEAKTVKRGGKAED